MQQNSSAIQLRKFSYDATEERAENAIGNALLNARKSQNLSQDDVVKNLNQHGVSITRRAYGKWETGDASPNSYQLLATCFALGISNLESLCSAYHPPLNSAGQAKLQEYEEILIATGFYRNQPDSNKQAVEVLDNVEYIDVLQATLRVTVANNQFLDDKHMETIRVPKTSVPPKADFAVIVSGDSMAPDFADGQRVWVKRTEKLKENEIGIFVYDGEAFIKQYHEVDPPEDEIAEYMDTDGVCHKQIVLVSLNPKYAPRVIEKSYPFQIVGRVLTLA